MSNRKKTKMTKAELAEADAVWKLAGKLGALGGSHQCERHPEVRAVASTGNADDGYTFLCGVCLRARSPVTFRSIHLPAIPGKQPGIHL